MTYLLTFALLVCGFWLAFLWWTAHPSPKPRQESRYEILEEAQIEGGEMLRYEALSEPKKDMSPKDISGTSEQLTAEELQRIMQKRDPFRRVK